MKKNKNVRFIGTRFHVGQEVYFITKPNYTNSITISRGKILRAILSEYGLKYEIQYLDGRQDCNTTSVTEEYIFNDDNTSPTHNIGLVDCINKVMQMLDPKMKSYELKYYKN